MDSRSLNCFFYGHWGNQVGQVAIKILYLLVLIREHVIEELFVSSQILYHHYCHIHHYHCYLYCYHPHVINIIIFTITVVTVKNDGRGNNWSGGSNDNNGMYIWLEIIKYYILVSSSRKNEEKELCMIREKKISQNLKSLDEILYEWNIYILN